MPRRSAVSCARTTFNPSAASARGYDRQRPDGPIFPDLARHKILDGPKQVWVADITYIAIAAGFVYMAAILDAWSRRVIGYAISRSIDAPGRCCAEGSYPSPTATEGLTHH